MKVISQANKGVLQILSSFRKSGKQYRMLKYCVHTSVDEGILLFNLMTRELVLLTWDEYTNILENDYLKTNWFVVPENTQEKEYVKLVRTIMQSKKNNFQEITGYTIFTTTDCNARCFYCFEAGRSRMPMSHETAVKVIQYIKNHCGGKKIKIGWFGGEPLMNQEAIDTICQGLRSLGIEYESSMVTNGYLFNDSTVDKALNLWNLKKAQITLDGTEEIYNKVKAYIYTEGNPFEIVLENIKRLLHANIGISIRLNMDLYNADDLLALTQDLCHRFSGQKNLSIYAHLLFDSDAPDADLYSDSNGLLRINALEKINSIIKENNFLNKKVIDSHYKINQCMADSGHSITILPDGHIGLCEHHSESEFIGHIDTNQFDQRIIKSFQETIPEIPECDNCFYYPDCVMLKKCNSSSKCYPQYIIGKYNRTENCMINTYNKFLDHN